MTDEANAREVLDWAEQASLETVRYGLDGIDGIKAQGRHLLALVTTAGGAGFAFAIQQITTIGWSAPLVGVVALAAYLYFVGALVVLLVLRMRAVPGLTNDPQNLAQPDFTLAALKGLELKNIQRRIERIRALQAKLAAALNRLQLALLFSPLAFFLAYWISA